MATLPLSLSFISILLITFSTNATASKLGKETETHLHFYLHEIFNDTEPSTVLVAQGPNTSNLNTSFGAVLVMDAMLTETPNRNSKLIGKAQGIQLIAPPLLSSQEDRSLLFVVNLVFVQGEFNGSSLAVLGRIPISSPVREMPVIGGTGRFRFARGYVLTQSYEFDIVKGDIIIEYDVHVLHY
ncbi:hypothetical protein J5N97_022301 [Dioscorea zingiberensis]|uniref:Dirigent protein n=1 Tax=Dioscorea zingiberensis TaxID=325984 RepID=A0A9D5HAI4_9LILI|nr:hypothetical protein J5N97_022301 [Dioscorea zingiberensis]